MNCPIHSIRKKAKYKPANDLAVTGFEIQSRLNHINKDTKIITPSIIPIIPQMPPKPCLVIMKYAVIFWPF
jgi:hypothetical protein